MSDETAKIIEKAQAAMERAGYREHKWTPALAIDHLLDRAEKAEHELAEAEKAIREADYLIGSGEAVGDVDRCAFRQRAAVRRAMERGNG